MEKLKVKAKWGTDAGMAVIYAIGFEGTEGGLYFYTPEEDPGYERHEEITADEFLKTKVYKQTKYSDRAIPNDAYMML